MGGPRAPAVPSSTAIAAFRLPAGAFLVRYVNPDQPDLPALEDPERIQKPPTLPDHVVSDDVHTVLKVGPDGSVAGMHGLVQEGTRVDGEPLPTISLDYGVPRVVLGTHPLQGELARRYRAPEQVDAEVHPALGGDVLKG